MLMISPACSDCNQSLLRIDAGKIKPCCGNTKYLANYDVKHVPNTAKFTVTMYHRIDTYDEEYKNLLQRTSNESDAKKVNLKHMTCDRTTVHTVGKGDVIQTRRHWMVLVENKGTIEKSQKNEQSCVTSVQV